MRTNPYVVHTRVGSCQYNLCEIYVVHTLREAQGQQHRDEDDGAADGGAGLNALAQP